MDGWQAFQEPSSPLDQYLGGGLAGQGLAFEQAGATHGVDPTLLAAISAFETGHGTSHALTEYNNVAGIMDTKDPRKFQKFDSVPDSINSLARNLSQNYISQGLQTIPDIASKYAPVGAKNDPKSTNAQWPGSVQTLYSQMGGTRTTFGAPQVAPAVNMMGGYRGTAPGQSGPMMSWNDFPPVNELAAAEVAQ